MPLLKDTPMLDGFTEVVAEANGVKINYAIGGSGPPVVLLHGYPSTWYSWRAVMPSLAEGHTVIAPDLRGSGGSDAPSDGYDKATLAEDVHQLLRSLGVADEVNVVGHDIGMMVAYAYAAAHRETTRRLVLVDAVLIDESLYQLPAVTPNGPGLWNFGFFMVHNGLPEHMLEDREDTWVNGFVDATSLVKDVLDPTAIAEYAEQLRRPGHLRASFEYFRAFPQDLKATVQDRSDSLTMPVMAIGGEASTGQLIADQARAYAADVTGVVVPSGHWVPEEAPNALLDRVLPFLE